MEYLYLCPSCGNEADYMPHDELWHKPPIFKAGWYCYSCKKNVHPSQKIVESTGDVMTEQSLEERQMAFLTEKGYADNRADYGFNLTVAGGRKLALMHWIKQRSPAFRIFEEQFQDTPVSEAISYIADEVQLRDIRLALSLLNEAE